LIDESVESRGLIREAWRLAEGLGAELLVAYADHERSNADRHELAKTLELAEDLNGRLVRLPGPSAAQLSEFLQREHIAHLALRVLAGSSLRRSLTESLVRDVMRSCPALRVHAVG
jgi:K+-sensing histidine kinase KdpD